MYSIKSKNNTFSFLKPCCVWTLTVFITKRSTSLFISEITRTDKI